MTTSWNDLGQVDPRVLVGARIAAHRAIQWTTRLARANLAPQPDDSHSNLGWDRSLGALLSHDVAASDRTVYRAGLRIDSMTLLIAQGSTVIGQLALNGLHDAEAGIWIDGLAERIGLRPASSVMLPYTIPEDADDWRYVFSANENAFSELAHWFDAGADVLQETGARLSTIKPGPSPVRCWPHHFDIATLVSLASGNPETAPSIGIGLSPGDDFYREPYFYITPWPVPPADDLPAIAAPGHWHTMGFTGAIAPAADVLALSDRRSGVHAFIDQTVTLCRLLLGA